MGLVWHPSPAGEQMQVKKGGTLTNKLKHGRYFDGSENIIIVSKEVNMEHKKLHVSSEQTLQLEQLRQALAEALPGNVGTEAYPVPHYATCNGTCLYACDGTCWVECISTCWPGCSGWCWIMA